MSLIEAKEKAAEMVKQLAVFYEEQFSKAIEESDWSVIDKMLTTISCSEIVPQEYKKKSDKLQFICDELGIKYTQDEEVDSEDDVYVNDSNQNEESELGFSKQLPAGVVEKQVTKIRHIITEIGSKEMQIPFNDDWGYIQNTDMAIFLYSAAIDLVLDEWSFQHQLEKDELPSSVQSVDSTDTTTESVSVQKLKLEEPSFLLHYKYFVYEESVEATQQTPLMNSVLQYILQNPSKFQFGTFEKIRLFNIEEAFSKYYIAKKSVYGEFNVKMKLQVDEHHCLTPHLLFAECQRTPCSNIFCHKDFKKLCLVMKSSLRQFLKKLYEIYSVYWIEHTQSVYGILGSQNCSYLMEMSVESIAKEKYRPKYTLKIIRKFDMVNDAEYIMKALYLIFEYGNSYYPQRNGYSSVQITSTPKEWEMRLDNTFPSYKYIHSQTIQKKQETEALLVNEIFTTQKDVDKFVLTSYRYLYEELWNSMKNTPNMYYVSKQTNSLVLINAGETQESKVNIITKYDKILICHTYLKESQAMKSFSCMLNITQFIVESSELSLVNETFPTNNFDKYVLTSYRYLPEDSWNSMRDTPNMYYVSNQTNLIMMNTGTGDTIHVISKHKLDGLLMYRAYSLSELNANKRKYNEVSTKSKKPKLEDLNTQKDEPFKQDKNQPTSETQQINDKSVQELSYALCAGKGLINFLNNNSVECKYESFVQRQVNPKNGVSLFLTATYNAKPVFVKVNCFKTYYQNRQLMEYLVSQKTSNHLNKVLQFKISEHTHTEIGEIFKLSTEVIEYLGLNGRVYLTVVEPIIELKSFLLDLQPKLNPLKTEAEGKFALTLIIKLLSDYMKGIKELHNMGIIHCDINFLNCQIDKIETKDEFSELVTFPYPFIGVIIDFNSSRLESQSLFSNEYYPLCTHFPSDHDDLFKYRIIPSISFTKSHDIYSLSFVITQLSIVILLNFTYLKYDFNLFSFILETRNPTDKDWLPKQWSKIIQKAPILFHNSQPLITIVSKLGELVCQMFKNPSSYVDTNYFETEISSIICLLVNYAKTSC